MKNKRVIIGHKYNARIEVLNSLTKIKDVDFFGRVAECRHMKSMEEYLSSDVVIKDGDKMTKKISVMGVKDILRESSIYYIRPDGSKVLIKQNAKPFRAINGESDDGRVVIPLMTLRDMLIKGEAKIDN